MGHVLTKIWQYLIGKPEVRILMVCWDMEGKTTIPYKLKGQDKIRPLWRHYYQGTKGLICMFGGNDRVRIEAAREELNKMLNENGMHDVVLRVFANKQDLLNATTAAEVTEKLGLHILYHIQWFIQSACDATGDGLYEGLGWLSWMQSAKR